MCSRKSGTLGGLRVLLLRGAALVRRWRGRLLLLLLLRVHAAIVVPILQVTLGALRRLRRSKPERELGMSHSPSSRCTYPSAPPLGPELPRAFFRVVSPKISPQGSHGCSERSQTPEGFGVRTPRKCRTDPGLGAPQTSAQRGDGHGQGTLPVPGQHLRLLMLGKDTLSSRMFSLFPLITSQTGNYRNNFI